MFGLTDRNLFLLAVLLYGASTTYGVFVWRRGFRRDDHVCYFLLLAGSVLHIGAMTLRGMSFARCPVANLFEASMFVGWAVAMAVLAVGWMRRFGFIPVVASPILFGLGVFGLMPGLDRPGPEPQFWQGYASLHASLTLLAYGGLGLAAVAGVMYLVQEHDLKYRKSRAFLAFLPPIQRLERVTWRLLLVGFVLLTLGLLLGVGWLHHTRGVFWVADAKLVWSACVWTAYLVMIILHWRRNQSDRRFAWSVVGAFAFVMLTFWGTNLLSRIHNPHP